MDRRTLLATPLAAAAAVPGHLLSTTPAIAAEADDYAGSFFKRQLYVVSDMERALTLWQGAIGFQPGAITTSGPNSYSREVFNIPARASMRFCTLSAGPQQVRTLALLEVTGVRLPRARGIRSTGAVIDARGRLDAIAAWARSQGLTVFSRRELTSQTQGTGTEQGFLDWDGNVVVLYEFPTPAAPPVR